MMFSLVRSSLDPFFKTKKDALSGFGVFTKIVQRMARFKCVPLLFLL